MTITSAVVVTQPAKPMFLYMLKVLMRYTNIQFNDNLQAFLHKHLILVVILIHQIIDTAQVNGLYHISVKSITSRLCYNFYWQLRVNTSINGKSWSHETRTWGATLIKKLNEWLVFIQMYKFNIILVLGQDTITPQHKYMDGRIKR